MCEIGFNEYPYNFHTLFRDGNQTKNPYILPMCEISSQRSFPYINSTHAENPSLFPHIFLTFALGVFLSIKLDGQWVDFQLLVAAPFASFELFELWWKDCNSARLQVRPETTHWKGKFWASSKNRQAWELILKSAKICAILNAKSCFFLTTLYFNNQENKWEHSLSFLSSKQRRTSWKPPFSDCHPANAGAWSSSTRVNFLQAEMKKSVTDYIIPCIHK